ncbi:hypothetical protein NQ317_007527 [Molorchus minor]|uniref:Uncharacterized protein n=1 Tax=Molorchus minor TaxID=1323400 RepID=A0ABQ9J3W1_9CUCU|nr:hypothetical protein NQ317_007527 [Molorchus minor]
MRIAIKEGGIRFSAQCVHSRRGNYVTTKQMNNVIILYLVHIKLHVKLVRGLEEMFSDIASQLVNSNRSRLELQSMEEHGFKITQNEEILEDSCLC